MENEHSNKLFSEFSSKITEIINTKCGDANLSFLDGLSIINGELNNSKYQGLTLMVDESRNDTMKNRYIYAFTYMNECYYDYIYNREEV